jgi:hypothetical protein
MSAASDSPRRRRWPWILGTLFVLFTVTGFFVAPPIIKSQLEKRASEALGRTVTVGKVRVNPYAMSLTLEDFDIRLRDNRGSFLGWKRLYVNFDPLASVLGTWTFGAIELDGFHATAQLQRDGSFSFHDILRRLAALATADTKGPLLPPLHIGSLKVNGAQANFADQSQARPFATTFGPVTFTLTEFRSVGKRGAPHHFAAVTEAGEKFEWTGSLSGEPFHLMGDLGVENLDLPKYAAYHGDRLKAEIRAGKLNFRGRYTVDLGDGVRALKLSGGELRLRGVQLLDAPDGEVAADFPVLDILGIEADVLAMKAAVANVGVNGGRLHVRRDQNGTLNVLTMLEPSPVALAAAAAAGTATATPAGPAPAAPVPDFLVGEVAVKDLTVDVTDNAAPRPAQLSLGAVQLSLKQATLAEGAVMPLAVAFNWAPQGTVKAEGTVAIMPVVKADLKTDVAAFSLLPLSAYLEQFVDARITQGAVTTSGSAQLELAGELPAISYAGDVSVEKLGLVDAAHNEELAGFASLTLTGLKAATAPKLAVSLAEVNLAAPYARVVVAKDRSINLMSVLKMEAATGGNGGGNLRPDGSATADESGRKAPPTSTPASAPGIAQTATPAAPAPLPDVKIGRVVIAGGVFSLQDQSFEPNVRTQVDSFGGIIGSLSSENLARGEMKLTATVDGVAPVMIAGKLDPFGAKPFVDIEIDAKNVELLPFSPYSGRYAGYELARGKLNSNLKLKLDGKQLDAANLIVLNGFTFGGPVESPDATSLPVRLGVALLKDSAGQIVIDVPVSGNIDDPEIRLRKAIMRVIGNLLTKAATSPFSLLGSLLGGGGEELAFQEFSPGLSGLRPEETPKLESVVKMLNQRPALGLALEGSYDAAADTPALQRLKLADVVRRRIWEERHAADPNIPPPDQLEITAEENVDMIRRLYEAKFPPGTEQGAPAPEPAPQPGAVDAPPPPKVGFIRRVVNALTGESTRPATAEEAQLAGLKEDYAAALEVAKDAGVPLQEMVDRLVEFVPVTDSDLQALAAARAERVRDYFLNEGKITADRIFLTQGTAQAKANQGPRVFLSPQ